ncbi:MAG: antibiotic biosynthesis monooxygenase [Longimicrobiales bacterium]
MMTEIVRYNIPAGEEAAFEEAYEGAQRYLAASPHCLGYELLHSIDEPQRYILRIQWTSVDGHINGFRKSPEFASFFAAVRPFFAAIEEMKHYEATRIVSGP